MLNTIAIIWGVITLLFALIFLIPLLGFFNWFVIPFALIGVILGAISKKKGGMWLNVIALFLSFFRLMIGGGIF